MKWLPFPKQEQALERPEYEVLYGGARGGGKTDAGLVSLTDYIDNPYYRGLVIRKNSDDLKDWLDRARRFYFSLGGTVVGNPAEIRFTTGAVIRTGHLKDDNAYTKYQGQEYQHILIEELTQIPTEKLYLQLIASCRTSRPELRPQVFATTNPGGIGHVWVKERFVDPAPPGTPFKDAISRRTRIFIPAKVDDNPALMKADPDYVHTLEALKATDEELWKAWRLGDWDTFAGQFFREFRRDLHVINPFKPDKDKYVFVGGMDWGRTAPFSFHLSAVEKVKHKEEYFYRVNTFLEVYGTQKTPQEWAEAIKKSVYGFDLLIRDIAWIRGDPAMFKQADDGGISIADQFSDEGIRIWPGDNDRIGGWALMHKWLSLAPDGKPYWQITRNCNNLIRTLPTLVHDEHKVEDVETEGEDHAADDQRYQFKHLKWLEGAGGVLENSANKKDKVYMGKWDQGQQVAIDVDRFQ